MQRRDYARIGFVVVFLVVLYYVFRILQPFLAALVWAAILTTVFYPVFRRLERAVRRRPLASVLTCLFLTFVIVVPVILLLIVVAGQSVEAYRFVESKIQPGDLGQFDSLRERPSYQWLEEKLTVLGLPQPDLKSLAVRAVKAVSEFLVKRSSSVFSGFANFVFDFFVMLFTMYYLFLRGPDVLAELRRLSPLSSHVEETIITKFKDMTVATFQATLVTSLVQGMAGGLVFFFFGIPAPILWGGVMSLLAILPWLWIHPEMPGNLLAAYSISDPEHVSAIQAVRDGRGLIEVARRSVSVYWAYFDPSFLFLSGGASRKLSTGQAGVFLLPVAVLMPIGIYALIRRDRRSWSIGARPGICQAPWPFRCRSAPASARAPTCDNRGSSTGP